MPRPEKVAAVEEIKDRFTNAGAVLVTEYRGLKVKDLQDLRRRLSGTGTDYKVLKNTLVRFAVRDLDVDLESYLEGPTALAFCTGDPVAAAKVLADFARTNPALVVKAGVLGGQVIDSARARALADVESREVLLAKIAGITLSPLTQAVTLMNALIRNTAVLVGAYMAKREEGGETATPAESVAPAEPAAVAEPEVAPPAEPEAAAETIEQTDTPPETPQES